MNKKLKVIIAAVIAIFFGLGIYTFASPNDETAEYQDGNNGQVVKKSDNTDVDNNNVQNEENEEEEEEENVEQNNNVQNNNNNVNNNPTRIPQEIQEEQEPVDETAPVVEVKYSSNKSSKEVKVEIVSNEPLKEVEDWELSEDKLTLTRIFNLNTDEEIEIKDLNNNITPINVKIDNIDNENPVIIVKESSVGSEMIYSKIDMEFTDNTEISKVEINGEEVEITPDETITLDFDKSLYIEGDNTIEVFDEAGNSESITFELDTTNPTFDGKEGSVYTTNVLFNASDKNLKEVKLNGEIYKRETITKDGKYTIVATDKAGNSTTVHFEVDKTGPIFKSFKVTGGNELVENKVTNHYAKVGDKIVVSVTFDEELGTKPTLVLNGVEFGKLHHMELGGNKHLYIKSVTLSEEDGIEDGLLEVKLTGYADDHKNAGRDITIKLDGTDEAKKNIIVDKTAPTFDGKEGSIYNTNVLFNTYDTNIKTITLNGEPYNRGTITKDGNYTLVAVDKAGNESTVHFTVDKTKPVANETLLAVQRDEADTSSTEYAKVGDTIVATVRFSEKLKTVPKFELISNNKKYSMNKATESMPNEQGEYTYTATYTVNATDMVDGEISLLVSGIKDLAGNNGVNVTETTNNKIVTIDRVKPEVLSQVQKYNESRERVELTTEFSETVVTAGGNNNVVKTTKVTTYYYRTKTVKVSYEDLAGNKNTYEVAIDMTAPTLEIEYSKTEPTNQNVTVTITSNEVIKEVEDWNLSEDKLKLTRTFESNTNGTVKVYDLVGNPKEIEYNIENIDKEAPIYKVFRVVGGNGKWENKVYNQYAKNGTQVDIYLSFDEKLGTVPSLKLNNIEFGTLSYFGKSDGKHLYYKSIKLKDNDGIVDGLLDIKVYGYADEVGNVGTELTMASNGTLGSQKNVIVDRTKATITPIGELKDQVYVQNIESGTELKANDILAAVVDNYAGESNIAPKKVDLILSDNTEENTYNYDASNGLNTKYARGTYNLYYEYTDKAGNKSTATLKINMSDTTYPIITVPGFKNRSGSYQYNVERGDVVTLEDMMATVTDNVDATVKINPYYADRLVSGIASENTYNYDFSNGFDTSLVGRYEIKYKYTDAAGNETTADTMLVISDTKKPEVTKAEQTNSLTAGLINVSLTFNEKVKEVNGVEVGKVDKYVVQLAAGEQTITFKDLAGNANSYKLTVEAPEEDTAIYLYTKADLLAFASNVNNGTVSYSNKTIKLGNDIDLDGETWAPLYAWGGRLNKVTIDGNGHSIKNMKTSGEDDVSGFIGSNASSVIIKNITFDGAVVKTKENQKQSYAGVVMGKNYSVTTFENITIKNSIVENNWQSGGILGFAEDAKQTFKNCHVEDTFVGGYNATSGTFFGLGIVDVDIIDSSAKNVQLYTDGLTWNSTQKKDNKFFVGHVYHAKGTKQTVTNSTEENVTIVIATADEFVNTFANGGKGLEKTNIELISDIDLAGKTYTAAENVAFTLNGNNHIVKNLINTTNSSTGALINYIGAGKEVTIKNLVLDNATVTSTSTGQVAVGGIVGQADTAKTIKIENVTIKNSTITNSGDGWTGGFVGYTAGYDVQNNGPVYSRVTVKDSVIDNSNISGKGSVGGIVGHAGGNPDTTTTIDNVTITNNTVTGPNNKNKTGLAVGTAHVGETIVKDLTTTNNTIAVENNQSTSEIYGRFVPGSTGTFTIDGESISAS